MDGIRYLKAIVGFVHELHLFCQCQHGADTISIWALDAPVPFRFAVEFAQPLSEIDLPHTSIGLVVTANRVKIIIIVSQYQHQSVSTLAVSIDTIGTIGI